MSESSSAKVSYPTFAGGGEENFLKFQTEFVKDNRETVQEMIKDYHVDTGGTKVSASFVGFAHLTSAEEDLGFIDDDPDSDSGQCYDAAVPGASGGHGSVSHGFTHLVSVSALDSVQCYDVSMPGGVTRYNSGGGGHGYGYTPLVSVSALDLDTGQ